MDVRSWKNKNKMKNKLHESACKVLNTTRQTNENVQIDATRSVNNFNSPNRLCEM